MRLIDADALIEGLLVNPEECPGCPEPEWLEDFINTIDSAPTIEIPACSDGDTISRAAAIDALIKADYEFTGILSEPRARRFEQTINALPSAQPEPCEELDFVQEHKKIPVVLDIQQKGKSTPSAQPDLSSYSDKLWKNAYERGKAEAQAEIVRCKDCKHYSHPWYCEAWNNSPGFPAVSDDMFCSMAERRTDGVDS